MIPVILAGGSGSRLWPLSRADHPKQFLALSGKLSMLQQTIKRLDGIDAHPPVVVCNEEHRFLVAEQLRQMDIHPSAIILEPVGRNTAPAIALAALYISEHFGNETMVVLPADHAITDQSGFKDAVQCAGIYAQKGYVVTFGIVPSKPESGYGYIRSGELLSVDGASLTAYKIKNFVEKPDVEKAKSYLAAGSYYWNSGMFVLKSSRYIEELEQHNPEMLSICKSAMENTMRDADFMRVDRNLFSSCPDDSIDYAVMEKTDSAAMLPLDVGWSDVGSWSALWELEEKDQNGNVVSGDVLALNSFNCYLRSEKKLVAAIGVENLVVVDTPDAVLIASLDAVQHVKEIVNSLKAQGRDEFKNHREVYRPWGKYDSVDAGGRFQVKRITVNPGAKLSVQMHHHRAEHWIVVSGTAQVTRGDEQFLVTENQSTYIPLGVIHALENPGRVPLEMVEVQSGTYLGEDDIVRFEDKYGRT